MTPELWGVVVGGALGCVIYVFCVWLFTRWMERH